MLDIYVVDDGCFTILLDDRVAIDMVWIFLLTYNHNDCIRVREDLLNGLFMMEKERLVRDILGIGHLAVGLQPSRVEKATVLRVHQSVGYR
jgi:hypothetical protein